MQREIGNVAAACRLAGFRYVSFTPPSFAVPPATSGAPLEAAEAVHPLPEPVAITVAAALPQPALAPPVMSAPSLAQAPSLLPAALPAPTPTFALLAELAPALPLTPPAPARPARKPGAFALLAASQSSRQDH